MKQSKNDVRYTIRLAKDVGTYVKAVSERRGISPSAFIKGIIGEYKEVNCHGERERHQQ